MVGPILKDGIPSRFRQFVVSHHGSTSAVAQVSHQRPSIFQDSGESSHGSHLNEVVQLKLEGCGFPRICKMRPRKRRSSVKVSHCFFERFCLFQQRRGLSFVKPKVSQAQKALAMVQSKLQFEEQCFVDGVARRLLFRSL